MRDLDGCCDVGGVWSPYILPRLQPKIVMIKSTLAVHIVFYERYLQNVPLDVLRY
jgi:hypothetical protein